MNLNTIKKEVRIAIESSVCAAKWAVMVDSRKKSMIDATARRVKEEGMTVKAATVFTESMDAFLKDLESRRDMDYENMEIRRRQMKGRYKSKVRGKKIAGMSGGSSKNDIVAIDAFVKRSHRL